MYPIDVPHLAKICTSHVSHLGTSVPHLGPDEMTALLHGYEEFKKISIM
jgi:hypothetical protein